jgi:cell fate (sporulation/competence/biofilm development) regulator YlbF (YheA/YmcA/DUF963 family)
MALTKTRKSRKSVASLRRRRAQLASLMPDLKRLIRGSLVERYKKCGKSGCHCAQDRGHGPAYYLSVTLAPGKTRSYYIPAELKDEVSRYLGNYWKLRELLEEIVRVNRQLLEQGALDDET